MNMEFLVIILLGAVVGFFFYLKKLKKQLHALEKERAQESNQIIESCEQKIRELGDEIDSRRETLAKIEQRQFDLQKTVHILNDQLEDYRRKREIINEAIMREKQIKEQEDFYKVNISQNDIADIQALEQIRPQLRRQEALSKLIWEVFVRTKATEMIKRVVGAEKQGGIYKITYTKTGESYIGRTLNFADRWTQHLKTTIGLDGCAHSTLHTRMEKDGFWNYTFEILEVVDKDKQAEREKYWIKFYDTTTVGLNQRVG